MTIWSLPRQPSARRRQIVLAALCGALPLLSLGFQISAKLTAASLSSIRFGPAWFDRLAHLGSAWTLLALELASFAVWMTILAAMKLSAAFPMTALSYVLVIGAGWGLFHERTNWIQILGGLTILVGIWLIAWSDAPGDPA